VSPAVIFLSAVFTGLTSLALGLLIARTLNLRLYRGEILPLAYLLGSAALSMAVFTLLCVSLAAPWSFALVGCAAISVCLWKRAWQISEGPAPHRLSIPWRCLFAAALIVWGLYTLVHAMAPEISPDGTAYHLAVVGHYFREGTFLGYTTNMYANMPMGVEMLFLFAYAFGRHSAAALVHWQFLLCLPFLLLACGRRFGVPAAGAVAGLLVFVSPLVSIDGASAYVDVAVSAVVVGLFLVLLMQEQRRSWGLLVAAGILAGFACACKMTAAPAIPFAIGFIAWTLWKRRELRWRPVAIATLAALVIIAPWLIKSAVLVGNPFSPFLNRVFPNPYVRISFEEQYRSDYRTYYGVIKSPSQIPLEVTVRGGVLNGLLGPVFLLAPLALLALRWPLGRRALLAALMFGLTYPGNIGTRFLLSSLPFVALAMALVITRWPGMAWAVVLFHGFLSWPGFITLYSDPYAWRLEEFRLDQALRRDSQDDFLSRILPGYRMAKMADAMAPAGARIFSFGGVAEAYTSHDIVIAYQAGLNNSAGEMLAAGVVPTFLAENLMDFRFPPRRTRRVRLVQTATTAEIWSVSGLHVFSPSNREYTREPAWRITAHPNRWDVDWAFDSSPVTRWKAWENSYPGEYIEIDFGKSLELGAVRAELTPDQGSVRMRVDVLNSDGAWETVSSDPQTGRLPTPPNPRRLATGELKRLGFTHLIVAYTEFFSSDMFDNQPLWGVTFLGDAGEARLYRLD
jgi:hypothetical protein